MQLYYLQSRYYNPEWVRFINADVIVGKTGTILTYNMFVYCLNNPINNEDPNGYISSSSLKKNMQNYYNKFKQGYYNSVMGISLVGLVCAKEYVTNKIYQKLGNGIKLKGNPLSKIKYTDKVKSQATLNDYHGFPESVDAFGSRGKISNFKGGDNQIRTKVEIPGSYKNQDGVFQYIIENNGACNHRLFVPYKK